MYLTNEEEGMLKGEQGPVIAKCMKLLLRLGEIYGADRMIKISSSQAAGVSYKSIGDPGLEFLKGFANEGAKVKVPTFLNQMKGQDLNPLHLAQLLNPCPAEIWLPKPTLHPMD